MKLRRRISVDDFTELPAGLAEHYMPTPDGSYALMVFADDGSVRPIEPPEDIAPLKSAFEKTKGEPARLRSQIAAVLADNASVVPHAQAEVLERRLAELDAGVAAGQRQFDKAMADLAAEYEPRCAEADKRLEAIESRTDALVLDFELAKTIRAAGGVVEFLGPKLEKFCKVERDAETGERRVVVVDQNGVRRDDPVTRQPVTAAVALEELRLFDARLSPAFTNGNGNGAHG